MEMSPSMAILYSEDYLNIFVVNHSKSMLRWETQISTSLQPE